MNPIFLSVDISQVAVLRSTLSDGTPDPVSAAAAAEIGGADAITAHLREDRQFITDRDIRILRETVKSRLNLKLALTDDLISVALAVAPQKVCFVPKIGTADYGNCGLDVLSCMQDLEKVMNRLSAVGCLCSVFIEPQTAQIDAAKKIGVSCVELNSAPYAKAENRKEQEKQLNILTEAAGYAKSLDLDVTSGHRLDYTNVASVAAIPHLSELNIGHSIVARSIFTGLKEAVGTMRNIIVQARAPFNNN